MDSTFMMLPDVNEIEIVVPTSTLANRSELNLILLNGKYYEQVQQIPSASEGMTRVILREVELDTMLIPLRLDNERRHAELELKFIQKMHDIDEATGQMTTEIVKRFENAVVVNITEVAIN